MSDYYDSWSSENNITIINVNVRKTIYHSSYGIDNAVVEYKLNDKTDDYIDLTYTMYTSSRDKYTTGPARYYFDP